MKNSILPAIALLSFLAAGCNRRSDSKIADLERKASEAVERRNQLEDELESQKLASERDAIERERMVIEDERMKLEKREGEAAAAERESLEEREEKLAKREGRMEQVQNNLEEKQARVAERDQQLDEREMDLAGREALPFEHREQQVPVADYGMFYDSLSSYGSWFESADYGYVWQPVAVRDSGWRPYTQGRWVCSDRGWTFISDEPFGWATYHYGRWTLLRDRGWIWVPGEEWAPSWVCWRESGSHIGWAPLPPETLAYRGRNWDASVESRFGIGSPWFSFVKIRNFAGPVKRHCLPVSQNTVIIGQTKNVTFIHIQNQQVICGGPRYRDVSDRIGRPFPFYRLQVDGLRRPGRDAVSARPRFEGDSINFCAPNVGAAWNGELKPRRVRDRLETVNVDRPDRLPPEITSQFRKNREDRRERAREAVAEMGGSEEFENRRAERLAENRNDADRQARRNRGNNNEARPPSAGNAGKPDRETRPRPDRERPERPAETAGRDQPTAPPAPVPGIRPDRPRQQRPENKPEQAAVDQRVTPPPVEVQPEMTREETPPLPRNDLDRPDRPRQQQRPTTPRQQLREQAGRVLGQGERDKEESGPSGQQPEAPKQPARTEQHAEAEKQAGVNPPTEIRETRRQEAEAGSGQEAARERQVVQQRQQETAERVRQAEQQAETQRQQQMAERQQQAAQQQQQQQLETQQRQEAAEARRQQAMAERQQQEMQRQQEAAERQQQAEAQRQQEMAEIQEKAETRRQQETAARQQQEMESAQRQQEEQQQQQRQEQERGRQRDNDAREQIKEAAEKLRGRNN